MKVIIDTEFLQKRIEELGIEIRRLKKSGDKNYALNSEILKEELEDVLSQSTPLIPEIEKAYQKGGEDMHNKAIKHNWKGVYEKVDVELFKELRKKYVSNLKINENI